MEIQDLIKINAKHADYVRVCELRDDYFAWTTGFGLDARLQRFVKRESEEEFNQRKRLTNQIVPSSVSRIKTAFQKAFQSNAISLSWGGNKDKEFAELLSSFYGESDPAEYLQQRYIDKSFIDPNGWLVVEFAGTDGMEYAKPYPYEVTSAQAHDFKIVNGVLQYLYVRVPNMIVINKKIVEGNKFTLYTKDRAVIAIQVSPDDVPKVQYTPYIINEIDGLKYFSTSDKNVFYQLIEPEPYNLDTPFAMRWGYINDTVTDHRTLVSVLESARPYIEKSLKTVSELDINRTLHAFAQKFQYLPACREVGCVGGQNLTTGGVCTKCNGTGVDATHTSGMDIVTLTMPKMGEEAFQLTNLATYLTPPIEILNWLQTAVDKMVGEINKSVFNSDVFSRSEIVTTATEQTINLQAVYDTLYPFAKHYARLWRYIVEQSALITEIDVTVSAIVSEDFKLKTTEELYSELKTALDNGAGAATIEAIKWDIANVKFKDDPTALKKYEVMNYFEPFAGKSPQEIAGIIATLPTSDYHRTLYTFFNDIFRALEMQYGIEFYSWTYDKQKAAIDVMVDTFTPEASAQIQF